MPLMCSEGRSLTCKRRVTNLNGGTSQIVQQTHNLDNENKTIKMNEKVLLNMCFLVLFWVRGIDSENFWQITAREMLFQFQVDLL